MLLDIYPFRLIYTTTQIKCLLLSDSKHMILLLQFVGEQKEIPFVASNSQETRAKSYDKF